MSKIQVHSTRLDATANIFFARQLEAIQAKVYEFEYPAFMAYQVIPISYDAPAGAEYITSTLMQSVGRARVINSYADDLPEAGVLGSQIANPVKSIGVSYRYSHQEIRAAMFANVNLPIRLAEAARRANDQKVNELAFFGDSSNGMTGLLNNPAIPSAPVPNDGVGGTTEWINKTPEQILRDLNLIANSIVTNTNGVEMPDTLLLPVEQYSLIASTPRSTNSDTTILEYFKVNNPYIENVYAIPQLAGAGPGGADIMIAYEYNSNKFAMEIPMAFTQYPPQERNLEFVIPCESRFGGVTVFFPLSLNIGEGI